MNEIKFDPKKLAKLNNPERLKSINPDLIWESIALKQSEVLVDIGAGTGFFAKEFAKKITGGKIHACDSSDIMVHWMNENVADKTILPLICSEASVELPSGIADLVYMINVHHEMIEPEKVLTEAHRLLKSDGKIAIIDWKAEAMEEGPPLAIRVPDGIIIEQLEKTGFINIVNHQNLPLHSFIVGQK